MTIKQEATVNMDDKQRICLTRVLSKEERESFNSFRIYRDGGRIILEPVCQVPERDHWIYKDPEALKSLLKGIKDAEEGRMHDLGSFAQYAKYDDKD
ncbi:MAG TPA: hypothetical protein VIH61_04185 [Waddliaceae bacterium]